MDPLVTVLTVTYQHAPYIRKCVEGVLSQRTTFPVEQLIGEDGGNDGTREICESLAAENPTSVKLFVRDRKDVIYINGRPTGRSNFVKLLNSSKGKYIAICEGDDYWTDPLKLQKQVDFMEAHPEYSMCFHRADLLKAGKLEPHPIPADVDLENVRVEDLLRTYNFITTASVMYRNVPRPLPDHFMKVPFGDLALHIIMATKGKVMCLPDRMSVYRIIDSGSWSKLDRSAQSLSSLEFYRIMAPHLTATQRAIVTTKRAQIVEKMAHERYPVNPKRKWVLKKYLQLMHRA